jgi:hypothetical protein
MTAKTSGNGGPNVTQGTDQSGTRTHALSLRAAVARGDQASARGALGNLIAAAGGWYSDMEARKAWRAEAFELKGETVRFTIERHPGSSWLTHRKQVWEVDTRTGSATSSEEVGRLTEAAVISRAATWREGKSSHPRDVAEAAIQYGAEVARDDLDDRRHSTVLGWVALSLPAVGHWRGGVAIMAKAIHIGSGGGVPMEAAREYARAYNAEARALWSNCVRVRRRAEKLGRTVDAVPEEARP